MKALFGLWQDIKVSDINRLLRPYGVRLVLKKSKEWGKSVTLTAHVAVGKVKVTKGELKPGDIAGVVSPGVIAN